MTFKDPMISATLLPPSGPDIHPQTFLFHACEPGRTVDLRPRRVELGHGWPETREEATAALYADFAENFDEDALLRPTETEPAP